MSSSGLAALDVTTGAVLAGCGAVCLGRRRSDRPSAVGLLLLLAAACWYAGSLFPSLVFLHRGPMVQLHLTYPTGRLLRRAQVGVICLGWAAAVYEGLADDVPAVSAGLALLVAVAALDLYRRSSGPARKAGGPALAAAIAFAAVLALSSANQLADLSADLAVAMTYDVVVCGVALGLTADLLAGRWTAATVADLVAQLSPDTDAAGLQAALRKAIGDPELVLGFWDRGRATYVDDVGRPLDLRPAPDQALTPVLDDGEPVAALLHAAAAQEDPRLLAGAAAAARLAVANARMRAAARARARRLAEARRRIVEVGDEQRRALAAELTGRTDQHLAVLDEEIARLAAPDVRSGGASAGTSDTVRLLRDEVAAARELVRELVRGVRPAALEAGGLSAALPALADGSGLPVQVRVDVGRLSPAIEAAAYFVCAEALTNVAKHAGARSVLVDVRRQDGQLAVDVTDDGKGGADPRGSGLRGLADRVEALGGTLDVSASAAGGTVVSARLPASVAAPS